MSQPQTLPEEPILLREDDGAVARLTLNRPAQFNALSEEMLDALQATFDEIAGFFSAYLPGANVVQVYSTHTSAAGTVTFDFSGKILFKPRRAGWESSALTVAPSGPTGSVSVASVRSEYNVPSPSRVRRPLLRGSVCSMSRSHAM